MRRFIFSLIFLLPELLLNMAAAQELPVLLMLKRSEQSDTSGCNFVEQVTSIVYNEILANRVKLWDSQKKEIQIIGTTVREIEKHSGVSFLNLETIFVYEMWQNVKKEITSRTIGMSFVHRSNTEEEVSFGYVDYNDLRALFLKSRINTNASGIYSATYANYALSKNYVYNIVQFAGKPVKSMSESEEIKTDFIKNLKFNESLIGYYPPDKYVSYIVDNFTEGSDQKSVNSKNLFKKTEEYFTRNQEVYLNLGGDRISSHLQKNKIKITRIEVNEIWRKVNDEILFDTKSVIIYVNDSALNEFNLKSVKDFDFTFNDTDLFTFMQSKEFNLIITKINSQVIKRKDALLYHKALMNSEWNKLIQVVTNY